MGFSTEDSRGTACKRLIEAVELAANAEEKLKTFENAKHAQIVENADEIRDLLRKKLFASRAALIACFNLVEAYLNGLAWDYLRMASTTSLSSRSRKLLEDTTSASIRDKLRRYPEIISGVTLWSNNDADLGGFLDVIKPFRDSLVHPSPFSAPQKFGGYDKLRLLYRIDHDTAQLSASLTTRLIARIHRHIHGGVASFPPWFEDIYSKFAQEE